MDDDSGGEDSLLLQEACRCVAIVCVTRRPYANVLRMHLTQGPSDGDRRLDLRPLTCVSSVDVTITICGVDKPILAQSTECGCQNRWVTNFAMIDVELAIVNFSVVFLDLVEPVEELKLPP